MRQQQKRLDRFNIKLVVISFEKGAGDPVPSGDKERGAVACYLDEDRDLYRYFGMHHAGFWDIWGLQTLWAYLRLIGRGRTLQKSTGDIYQRGGDVLLDPETTVRFHRIADGPGDRPDPEELFRVVENHS